MAKRKVSLRTDGRHADDLRPHKLTRGYLKFALGSCLVECGETRVVCSASWEERVPPFRRGQAKGWLTAEYGMLPASCKERIEREARRRGQSGRTQEIQRMIGRALRSVVDLAVLGENTIVIDADVVQGDGGTRTAAVTGAFVALSEAVDRLIADGKVARSPIRDHVAAVSVGIVNGDLLLDLSYEEDARADVDMNVVMTGSGRLVEVQGTAEGDPFTPAQLDDLVAMARVGIRSLISLQKKTLARGG